MDKSEDGVKASDKYWDKICPNTRILELKIHQTSDTRNIFFLFASCTSSMAEIRELSRNEKSGTLIAHGLFGWLKVGLFLGHGD